MHEQMLMALANHSGIKIPDGIQVRIEKDYAKAEHLLFLSDTNTFFELAKSLFNKKWVVCLNKTNNPLWVSDNPLSLHNDFNYEGNLGIWCPGVEIRFPLTQGLLLFSYDPERHVPLKNRDKLLLTEVALSNESQIRSSTRFIYSPVDNFETARSYLTKYPQYRKPDRSRWKVISNHSKIEFIKF